MVETDSATTVFDRAYGVTETDCRLLGTFVEHLGRAVAGLGIVGGKLAVSLRSPSRKVIRLGGGAP